MFALDAAFAADHDRAFAAAFLAEDFHGAVDLRNHRRVLGLAGLENFRHPRQAAGYVLRARYFPRRLGQQRSRRNHFAFPRFHVGLFRQIIKVQNFSRLVFQHDLRVQIAFVFHHQHPHVTAGIFLQPHRLALDHVLVAHFSVHFRENGYAVRIPLAKQRARLYFLVLVDEQKRPGRYFVFFQFPALGIENQNFSVAGEHHLLAFVVAHHFHARKLHDADFLCADLTFFHGPGGRAADVKRAHR